MNHRSYSIEFHLVNSSNKEISNRQSVCTIMLFKYFPRWLCKSVEFLMKSIHVFDRLYLNRAVCHFQIRNMMKCVKDCSDVFFSIFFSYLVMMKYLRLWNYSIHQYWIIFLNELKHTFDVELPSVN